MNPKKGLIKQMVAKNQAQVVVKMKRKVNPGTRRQKSLGPQVRTKILKRQINPGLKPRKMIPVTQVGTIFTADEHRVRSLGDGSWATEGTQL